MAVCLKLAGLKNLQHLVIAPNSIVPGDARALSTLTALTRLVLAGQGAAVDDTTATLLACSLKQLQHLDLGWCELGDMVCIAAIGQLTLLTELGLAGSAGLTRDGLMLLTGLSRLQKLRVEQVTDEHVKEFWAAVRRSC